MESRSVMLLPPVWHGFWGMYLVIFLFCYFLRLRTIIYSTTYSIEAIECFFPDFSFFYKTCQCYLYGFTIGHIIFFFPHKCISVEWKSIFSIVFDILEWCWGYVFWVSSYSPDEWKCLIMRIFHFSCHLFHTPNTFIELMGREVSYSFIKSSLTIYHRHLVSSSLHSIFRSIEFPVFLEPSRSTYCFHDTCCIGVFLRITIDTFK